MTFFLGLATGLSIYVSWTAKSVRVGATACLVGMVLLAVSYLVVFR
jgi:hypothetical protein